MALPQVDNSKLATSLERLAAALGLGAALTVHGHRMRGVAIEILPLPYPATPNNSPAKPPALPERIEAVLQLRE